MATSTGTDSPVSGARLTDPVPETIIPSAGINSPLRISRWSPFITNPIGTSSTPGALVAMGAIGSATDITEIAPLIFLEIRRAVRGRRSSPPCIAFLALIRASPSICSVHETRIRTIKASSQA